VANATNIEQGGAAVSLTIDNAKLQQTIDRAKGQMAELATATIAARQRMRTATKAGNAEEAAGEKVVLASLQGKQRAILGLVNQLSGGGDESLGLGGGLVKAGKFGRGAAHVAALFGGEIGGHVAGGLLGAGHMLESGKSLVGAIGASGMMATAGLAAFGLAVVKIGEWAERSAAKMIELDTQSRAAAADYRQMRAGGDREGWLRKRLEEAEADLSKANADAQHWYRDTDDEERTAVHNAQNNVQKLREMLRQAEKEGSLSLTPSEGIFGAAGAKYLGGYSIPNLLEQIAGNTAATAAALHTS
jgi:hypothetical protein